MIVDRKSGKWYVAGERKEEIGETHCSYLCEIGHYGQSNEMSRGRLIMYQENLQNTKIVQYLQRI